MDRQYVTREGRRMFPESRGRIVTSFLSHYFGQYVNTKFSAEMEEKLDNVSAGALDYRHVLGEFWHPFEGSVTGMKDTTITEVRQP